ncbi:MAG: hypothetical protein FWE32_01630, partial [Oscillospiraceae bacterium]|nr:hypothetical protein [Oscillospiraceae bacterium]
KGDKAQGAAPLKRRFGYFGAEAKVTPGYGAGSAHSNSIGDTDKKPLKPERQGIKDTLKPHTAKVKYIGDTDKNL